MYYYKERIKQFFVNTKLSHILEIGGGFGGLCNSLMSDNKLSIKTYVLIDLPENLILSYYYLKNLGYNIKFILSEENIIDVVNRKLDKNERVIIFLSPWMFSGLDILDIKFELFINIMSFQHMTMDNIIYYFDTIRKLEIPFLYLVNRDLNRYPIYDNYTITWKEKWLFSQNPSLGHLECLLRKNE